MKLETKEEYERAREALAKLQEHRPSVLNPEENERLMDLVLDIEEYEDIHFPVGGRPSPAPLPSPLWRGRK